MKIIMIIIFMFFISLLGTHALLGSNMKKSASGVAITTEEA
jgi:hypothetical protein